jgi:hypothetical protein
LKIVKIQKMFLKQQVRKHLSKKLTNAHPPIPKSRSQQTPSKSMSKIRRKKEIPQKALRKADSLSTTSLHLSFPKQTLQMVKPAANKTSSN